MLSEKRERKVDKYHAYTQFIHFLVIEYSQAMNMNSHYACLLMLISWIVLLLMVRQEAMAVVING